MEERSVDAREILSRWDLHEPVREDTRTTPDFVINPFWTTLPCRLRPGFKRRANTGLPSQNDTRQFSLSFVILYREHPKR